MAARDRLPAVAVVVKLAITLGLFAWLLRKVEVGPVLDQLRRISPGAAIAAEALLVVQLGLLAWRWHVVNAIVDAPMRFVHVLRLSAIGHFFNQVLPSGFAGDAARAWLAAREGIRAGPAVRSIVCDRVVGLLALVAIVSVTLFALPEVATRDLPGRASFRAVAVLGVCGLVVLLLIGPALARALQRHRLGRAPGRLVDDLHRVLFRAGGRSAIVALLAVAVQLVNVAAMYACARGLGVDLGVAAALVIVPAVMLVTMAPISFAGWGIREGAMVVGLGLVGIAAADALAVSVAFGLVQSLLGVPGGILWLSRRGGAADARVDASK